MNPVDVQFITIPYLPILGPVHPSEIGPELLAIVLDTSRSGLLPYDKTTRWSSTPHRESTGL